jgi:hypothetical protein
VYNNIIIIYIIYIIIIYIYIIYYVYIYICIYIGKTKCDVSMYACLEGMHIDIS